MKRKDHDLIHAYVFGDLDEGQARLFEARLEQDEALRRQTDSMRAMRASLAELPEPPECQLSVERVRDAIMKLEMKQRPRSRFAWQLVAGPAAIALAFVTYLALPEDERNAVSAVGTHPAVQRELTSTLGAVSKPDESTNPKFKPSTNVARRDQGSRRVQTKRPHAAVEVAQNNRIKSSIRDEMGPEASRNGSRVLKTNRLLASIPKVTPDLAGPDEIGANSVPQAEEEVVVINPETSDRTGALTATEVVQSRYVVIGG